MCKVKKYSPKQWIEIKKNIEGWKRDITDIYAQMGKLIQKTQADYPNSLPELWLLLKSCYFGEAQIRAASLIAEGKLDKRLMQPGVNAIKMVHLSKNKEAQKELLSNKTYEFAAPPSSGKTVVMKTFMEATPRERKELFSFNGKILPTLAARKEAGLKFVKPTPATSAEVIISHKDGNLIIGNQIVSISRVLDYLKVNNLILDKKQQLLEEKARIEKELAAA